MSRSKSVHDAAMDSPPPIRPDSVDRANASSVTLVQSICSTAIDEDGWRLCVCGCGARFRPWSTTQFYADARCVHRSMKARGILRASTMSSPAAGSSTGPEPVVAYTVPEGENPMATVKLVTTEKSWFARFTFTDDTVIRVAIAKLQPKNGKLIDTSPAARGDLRAQFLAGLGLTSANSQAPKTPKTTATPTTMKTGPRPAPKPKQIRAKK
jgi:hypothetical protein